MLNRHEEFIPCIRGIHLQQSLTGAYAQEWLRHDHPLSEDSDTRFCQLYEHIFAIDRHLPFTAPGARELVERIKPDYLTLEYIIRNREEHAEYLRTGVAALTSAFHRSVNL